MDTSLVIAIALILTGGVVAIVLARQPLQPRLRMFVEALYIVACVAMVVFGIADRPHRYFCFMMALVGFSAVYRRFHAGRAVRPSLGKVDGG